MANPILESLRNTYLLRPRKQRTEIRNQTSTLCLLFSVVYLVVFISTGCGPKYSYLADTVPKAIESITQKEYKFESFAQVAGKTVGVLVYLESILDSKGQVEKDVYDTMAKAMQVLTRVTTSTDLSVDFCKVIIRDRKNFNEFAMIRSLDDTKKAYSDMIGVEESLNRTVFEQLKYTPESRDKFVLNEVMLENFLTDQIVQRIRFSFAKDTKDAKDKKDAEDESKDESNFSMVLADGGFDEGVFHFSVISLKSSEPRESITSILRIVSQVLEGYKFKAFNKLEIHDYLNRQKLVVSRDVLLDFQAKKITEKEILDKYLIESQSIQEAFKLFGFELPKESPDKPTPVNGKVTS